MAAKLIVAVIVIPFNRGVLDGAVHPFDLAIGPRMVRFGQAMFDPIGLTDQIDTQLAESKAVSVPRLLGELDAVVCQDRVDFVRHGLKQVL